MWFKDLMGFLEESPQNVQENLTVTDGVLTSRINGKSYKIGDLEIPSLGDLRARIDLSFYNHDNHQIKVKATCYK